VAAQLQPAAAAAARPGHQTRPSPQAPVAAQLQPAAVAAQLQPAAAAAARPGHQTRPSPQGAVAAPPPSHQTRRSPPGALVAQLQPAGADMAALLLAARPGQAE
jgi:hypothetical protein